MNEALASVWEGCVQGQFEDAPLERRKPHVDNVDMLDAKLLNAEALKGLSQSAITELATSLLAQLAARDEEIARRDREIKFKDVRLERLTFQLAQFKAWKYGARTEAMNAEQRRLFEETVAEDEADLEAQLAALKAEAAQDKSKRLGTPP